MQLVESSVRPFQIDLLFLGPPSQIFGVGRSTRKRKKNDSLPAFSKRVAKLSLQLHLTIDLPFSTVELRFTVTLGQAKSLPVAISAFHDLYRNYSNYCPLFLIIQFFCFFNSINQNCGSVGPEKQQINLEWPYVESGGSGLGTRLT